MTAGGPEYETAQELMKRTGHTDTVVCRDCGAFVMDRVAHNRFHAIVNALALSLSVLKVAYASDKNVK